MKMFQCRLIDGNNLFVRVVNMTGERRALWYADGEENNTSLSFTHLLGVCVFQPNEASSFARVLLLLADNDEVTDVSIGMVDCVQADQLANYIRSMC